MWAVWVLAAFLVYGIMREAVDLLDCWTLWDKDHPKRVYWMRFHAVNVIVGTAILVIVLLIHID